MSQGFGGRGRKLLQGEPGAPPQRQMQAQAWYL